MQDDVDVIVVGAGACGLRVAARLSAQGRSVAVFEARERVGGRLLSAPLEGARHDLGATWFWDGEPRVDALVRQLGLGRFPQHLAGAAVYDHPRGVQAMPDNPVDQPAWRLDGGMQRLAEAMAATLPAGTVRLGRPVRRVAVTAAGALQVDASDGALAAHHVVIALPPALAVAGIAFDPGLPERFAALAARTPVWMGAMTKVVAVYDTPFWRADGLAGAAFSLVGPLREVHDMSPADGSCGALFGFLPDTAAADVTDAVLRQLGRLFGARATAPRGLRVQDWRREPWTSPPGVERLDDYALFGHPLYRAAPWDGRLHFASTETAPVAPGHVEGALAAADHAVAAILAAEAG